MNINIPRAHKNESNISIDQTLLLAELRSQEQIIRQKIEEEIADQKNSGKSIWDKLKSFIPNALIEKKEIYLRILKKQLQIKEELLRDSTIPQKEKSKLETEINDIKSKISLIEKTKNSPKDVNLLSSILLQTELLFGVKRRQGREFLAIEQAMRVSESFLQGQIEHISIDGNETTQETTQIEISFPQEIQKKIINFIKKPRRNTSFNASEILSETDVMKSICEFIYSNYPNISLKTNKKEALTEIEQIAKPQLISKLNQIYSQYYQNKILFNAMFKLQIRTIKPLALDSRDPEEVRADLRQIFASFSDVSGKSLLDPVRLVKKSLQNKFATTSRQLEAGINRVSRPAAYAVLGFLGAPGVGASVISGSISGALREKRRLQEERLKSQISQILGTKTKGLSGLVKDKVSPIVGKEITDKFKITDEQYKEIFSSQLHNPLELLENDPSKLLALLQLEEQYKVLLIDYSKYSQNTLSTEVSELSRVYIIRSKLLSAVKSKSTNPSEVEKHKASLSESIEKRLSLVKSLEFKIISSSAVKSAVIAGTISSIVPFIGKGVAQFVTERLGDLYEEFESLGIISDLSRISSDAAKNISSSIKFPDISKESLLKLPTSGISAVLRLLEKLRKVAPELNDDLSRFRTEAQLTAEAVSHSNKSTTGQAINLSDLDESPKALRDSKAFTFADDVSLSDRRTGGRAINRPVLDESLRSPRDSKALRLNGILNAQVNNNVLNSPSNQTLPNFDTIIDDSISEIEVTNDDYNNVLIVIKAKINEINLVTDIINNTNLTAEEKKTQADLLDRLNQDLAELYTKKDAIIADLSAEDKIKVSQIEFLGGLNGDSYKTLYDEFIKNKNTEFSNFLSSSKDLSVSMSKYFESFNNLRSNTDENNVEDLLSDFEQKQTTYSHMLDVFDKDSKIFEDASIDEKVKVDFYLLQQFEIFNLSINSIQDEIKSNEQLIDDIKGDNPLLFDLFNEEGASIKGLDYNLFSLKDRIYRLKGELTEKRDDTELQSQLDELVASYNEIVKLRDEFYEKSGYSQLIKRNDELEVMQDQLLLNRGILFNLQESLDLRGDNDNSKDLRIFLINLINNPNHPDYNLPQYQQVRDLYDLSTSFRNSQLELLKRDTDFETEEISLLTSFNASLNDFNEVDLFSTSKTTLVEDFTEYKFDFDSSTTKVSFPLTPNNDFELNADSYSTYFRLSENNDVLEYLDTAYKIEELRTDDPTATVPKEWITKLKELSAIHDVKSYISAKESLEIDPSDTNISDLSTQSTGNSQTIKFIGDEFEKSDIITRYGGSDVVSETDTVPHWRGPDKLEIVPSQGSNINLNTLSNNDSFKVALTDSNGKYIFLDKSYLVINEQGNIVVNFTKNQELSDYLKNNRVEISYGILDKGNTFTRAETFYSSGANKVFNFNDLKKFYVS